MTSPVTFVELPSGRIVAKFGGNEIGDVMPLAPGPGARVAWRFFLSPLFARDRHYHAASPEKARAALQFAIEEWLDHAGPAFARLAESARAHREERL